MQGFAFDVRAGVEQHKFIFLPWNDRGNAAAIHAGDAAQLESGRRKNAAGVAEGNDRIGLAVMDKFGAAANGTVAFFAKRGDGFVVHRHDFAGMNDLNAQIVTTGRDQRGLDFRLITNQKECGDFCVGLQRTPDALDDDRTPVVTSHDIYRYSHR